MREDSKEKIERNESFVLVETLGSERYRASHLPDTINLPLSEIDHAEKVPPDEGGDRRLLQEHQDLSTRRSPVNWRLEAT